jgi:hypothetical protein
MRDAQMSNCWASEIKGGQELTCDVASSITTDDST